MLQVVPRLIPRDWGYGGKSRRVAGLETDIRIYWRRFVLRLVCCMAKKPEAVDNLLEALVWMRRKAKKHEPVDNLIDALMKMRRKAKRKARKAKKKARKAKKKAVKLGKAKKKTVNRKRTGKKPTISKRTTNKRR